jgi:hypothetical protein
MRKMKNVREYRAIALLCRQQAVFHPQESWKWLGRAERWEHLAEAEISAAPPKECRLASSNGDDLAA